MTSGGTRSGPRTVLAVAFAAAVVGGCGSGPVPSPAGAEGTPGMVATSSRSGVLSQAPVRAPVDSGAGPTATEAAPEAAAADALEGDVPFLPQHLRLPSGRTVEVVRQGTAPDGQLEIPEDPATVGWWSGASRPGDPYGSVVMAGHIDSRTRGIGALAEVATAPVGARLQVSGAGAATYRITSVEKVAKDRLVTDTDAFARTGTPRLVLITCGGAFDAKTRHYEDNVVVTAEPVGG